jgi:hypothetical protein
LLPRDTLYAVVTQATSGSVDLSSLNIGGYEAFQTNWTISDIPDRSAALDAINVMLINDIDTGDLTRDQHEALKSWVMGGGHLIVAGGANWQSTAAGLEDLLPLVPTGSETVADLTQLTRFAGDYETEFTGEVIAATGTLTDSAEILVTAEDDIPLAVRQSIGAGTVDYVAVDPSSQPLRGWDNLPDLWFSLLSSTDAQPSWTHGFSHWDDAISSVEIIPGVNLLPAVLGLFGFLAGYVFLIGPVNYLVLRRFNRLEYAWITTPALIVVFSALAWSVGVDLRGTDATLSRVSVIQTWTDSDEARIDQLIGLLAPRRADYSLLMTDERLLRPVSDALLNVNPLGGRLQTNVDIQQTTRFAAVDFPVDASFIAAFNASGVTQKPDISGRMTLTSTGEFDTLQGSIRNDSLLTLTSPVVLARGIALYLENAIEPGDIVTVNSNDMTLTGESAPAPSSLEYAEGDPNPFATVSSFGFRRGTGSYESESIRSAVDILGADNYKTFDFSVSFKDDDATQEIRRRQAFLDSFMVDQFSSTARGNHVYLAGWVDSVPTTEEVEGAGFKTVDTTLYIIELEVERQLIGEDTLITGDQFTWISRERTGVSDIGHGCGDWRPYAPRLARR